MEKELGIKPDRSPGGQRFYEEKDFETFKTVKHLLYDQKFTLAGAKKRLKDLKKVSVKTTVIASTKTESMKPEKKVPLQLQEKMFNLKKQHQITRITLNCCHKIAIIFLWEVYYAQETTYILWESAGLE